MKPSLVIGSRDDVPSILVIDDDSFMRALFGRLLQSAGFSAMVAENGPAGIALAEETRPSAILLDVNMPDMDGYAVCRHLKNQLSTADTPIVFVTGNEATPESINTAFDVGADDFLVKPVNKAHLLARIRVLLRQQSLREAYRRLATQDALTGLTNRRQIFISVTEALMRARKDGTAATLILADIDKFKQVNDRYGHDFGDEVIVNFARVLQRVSASSGSIGRIGGEEFTMLVAGDSPKVAAETANRIRELFAAIIYDADGDPKQFTASFGLATYDGGTPDMDPDKFLKQADIALYIAKSRGRNCVVKFWELDPASLQTMPTDQLHARNHPRQKSERSTITAARAVESERASPAPTPTTQTTA